MALPHLLVCKRRQGSTLCPVELEHLSLRKVRRDYRGKDRKRFSGGERQKEILISSKHRWKNTISGMTLILATMKLKESSRSKNVDGAEQFALNIIQICWLASASGFRGINKNLIRK